MPTQTNNKIGSQTSQHSTSVLQTQPKLPVKKPQRTVIFIDWDDTLLCSSYLSSAGYRLDSETVAQSVCDQLLELEVSVIALLTLALKFGDVHVVTNAETGWVQLSAKKFIPRVLPILDRVKILSARSTYEPMFPDAPLKWKFYAFQEKLACHLSDHATEKHIISFGDSHVEREAVRAVTRGLQNTKTKSVKFAERPSMEQLRRQIDHNGDLDLQLTVTINEVQDQGKQKSLSPKSPQISSPMSSALAS